MVAGGETGSAVWVTFAVYLTVMLGIGVFAYRLTHNLSDYFLGGRSLGSGTAALSAGASDMSGWLLMGLPGALYADGMNQIWIAVGLVLGAYLNWQFVAARLRRYTEIAGNAVTLPDFFEQRLRDTSRALRVVSAGVILLFFTFYTAAGLVSGGLLFESTFGWDYQNAVIAGTLAIVLYTFLGGFLAVSWTDFLQGIFMLVALLVVPVIAVVSIGGWETTTERIATDPGMLDAFHEVTALGAISLMAWGLGYFGQPHILVRFMALRSAEHVPLSRLIAMVWMSLCLLGAIFTGFIGAGFFEGDALANSETVFIELAQVVFHPWVAGALMAAILAAIMSTIDSQLLVSSSAIAEDFYRGLLRPRASDRELVWIGRGAVIAIAGIAFGLALNPEGTILDLVGYAWAGFGAAFGPIVLLSLVWPRFNRHGALAGMLAGAVTVVVWGNLDAGLFELYELFPAFLVAFGAAVITSLLTAPPPPEVSREFARVRS